MRHALAACLLLPLAAAAGGFEDGNASSFARAFAIPAMGRGAVLADGETEARATLNWSNEFYDRASSDEALLLDAESQRLTLAMRYGFANGWEGALELPFISSGGGVLDGLIESWHDTFGMPNGNRQLRPRDQYRIQYQRNGQTVLLRTTGSSSVGDLRLSAGKALTPALTLRGLLQLPTGDANTLTGGHTGAALWAEYTTPITASGRTKVVWSLGGSAAETGGALAKQQQPVLGVAGAALTMGLTERLDALVEINSNSKLYRDSGQAPLSHAAAVVQFGGRYTLGGTRFELAAIEDGSVNASPDFGFHFALSRRW
jgi:Protein of unknown function (DUF3187)